MATDLALRPGLTAGCPTCDADLVIPPMVAPADAPRPVLMLKVDVECPGCGARHRIYLGLIPDVDKTCLVE